MHCTRFNLDLTEQIHEDRHQLRMEMVFRLFDEVEIYAMGRVKRRIKQGQQRKEGQLAIGHLSHSHGFCKKLFSGSEIDSGLRRWTGKNIFETGEHISGGRFDVIEAVRIARL